MKYIIALLTFAILLTPINALTINEVMAKGDEWVEIYNPDDYIDLSMWNISDNYSTDQITCYNITNCNLTTNSTYFIIIGRSTNISKITNSSITYFYVDDSTIGNGLNDNGDVVFISNSSSSNSFLYNSSSSNESWSWNGSWSLCQKSPGLKNLCPINAIENTTKNTNNNTTANNTINSTINSTIPIVNYTNNTICDFYPEIISKNIYNTDQVEYEIYVKNAICNTENNFSFLYWIEDTNGKVVKDTINTSSSTVCSKTFSRSWTSNGKGLEVYIIKTNLSAQCDTNISNNYAEKMIAIKGLKEPDKETRSYINIEYLERNISWYSEVTLPINIYRGDTSKYAVHLYITGKEKVSNIVSININTKFSNNTFKVSLNLKDPCKNNLQDGKYTLVIEGLDKTLEIPILINGADCEEDSKDLHDDPIFNFPKIVYIGDSFNTTLTVNNTENKSLNITVYSYVYYGNKLLSKGFNGKWLKSWDANKKTIKIIPNSTETIYLENKIDDDVQGTYKIKLRMLINERKEDIISDIKIVINNKTQVIGEEINSSFDNISKSSTNKITGNIFENKSKTNEKSVLDSIKDWISSIFMVKKDADNWI